MPALLDSVKKEVNLHASLYIIHFSPGYFMENNSISDANKGNVKWQIVGFVLFTFMGYFCIGLPLAVLPIFIHKDLGYSELIAGIVISVQYAATFLFRGYAGNIVDKKGPKPAVLLSMGCFVVSGIFLILSYLFRENPVISIAVLVMARLITGCAEGMVGASPINWAMMTVGKKHTATAISYNGIASYGALALGAPLGVLLNKSIHISGLGWIISAVGIVGLLYAVKKPAALPTGAKVRASFLQVLKIVAPFGICLAMAGLGFGALSNFVTLYYDYFHWQNAALCLSVFGGIFILCRLFFSNMINKYGGMRVAIVSLIIEACGMFFLWQAHDATLALVGAGITGMGFSLIFPALGVEAVRIVPDANKGAALAGYGLFIDISLGITGPVVGGVIHAFGMHSLFSFCAVMVVLGTLLCIFLYYKYRRGHQANPSV